MCPCGDRGVRQARTAVGYQRRRSSGSESEAPGDTLEQGAGYRGDRTIVQLSRCLRSNKAARLSARTAFSVLVVAHVRECRSSLYMRRSAYTADCRCARGSPSGVEEVDIRGRPREYIQEPDLLRSEAPHLQYTPRVIDALPSHTPAKPHAITVST